MVAKQTGRVPEELIVPEVNPAMMFVKYCFDSLSTYRDWEGGYPKMLSPRDIYYWSKLENVELGERQLRALKKLDIAQVNKIVELLKERK